MNRVISIKDMHKSLADILNRVFYQGKIYEIKRDKQIIAKLIPTCRKSSIRVNELNDFFSNMPVLDKRDLDTFCKDLRQVREASKPEKDIWG